MSTVSRPVSVKMPAHGIAFAESVHAANFSMPVRADPFHKIVYVLGGRVLFRDRHRNREFAADAGILFTIDDGTIHQFQDELPATLLLLCVAPKFLSMEPDRIAVWERLRAQGRWHVPTARPSNQRFENLWRRALLEQTSGQVGAVLTLHALASQIMVALARWPSVSARSDTATRRIQLVIEELKETFYDEWTLDRAAARAGLSRRRFSELFRREAGDTFLDTLIDLRLKHAAKLLRDGAHSVTGVAFSCGYRDLSHFYRMFRNRYRCAPGEFPRRQG